jgi:hypothetical protein
MHEEVDQLKGETAKEKKEAAVLFWLAGKR